MKWVRSLKLPRFHIPTKIELMGHSYKVGHTSYFAFVFLEGHGYYALIGGFLFVLSVLDVFFHFEG